MLSLSKTYCAYGSKTVERSWAVNYFSVVLLCNRILPLLKKHATANKENGLGGRLVNVSSIVHASADLDVMSVVCDSLLNDAESHPDWSSFGAFSDNEGMAYNETKLALNYYTDRLALNNPCEESGLKIMCLHPGWGDSELARTENMNCCMKTFWFGIFIPAFIYWVAIPCPVTARTQINCAVAEDIVHGEYYANCKIKERGHGNQKIKAACEAEVSSQEFWNATHKFLESL